MKSIFITARLSSSRLPFKHIKTINNKYCIEYVFERVKRSKLTDNIILCTTTLEEDNILCELAKKHKIDYFRGSVKDKLDRWLGASIKYDIDFFVTADADDLFCEPELIDLAFSQYNYSKVDLIEWDQNELICGSFTYGIKTSALKKVCKEKQTDDTEMMWVFFNSTKFKKEKLLNVPEIFKRPEIRLTLDYEEDFLLFSHIITHFGHNNFSLRDVVKYINTNPEILMINGFRHNDWKQNQDQVVKRIKNG